MSKDEPLRIYSLVDEHGTGMLLPWVRYGMKTNNFTPLHEFFDTMVKYFMYNDGNGKFVPVSELVMIRNKQRNAILSALRRKKGRGKSGPNILEEFDQSMQSKGDLSKALKVLDGFVNNNLNIKYRMVVWDIAEKGKMGENLLHLCMLHNTPEHNTLARRLVEKFPKLVNDIFISEEYYGLSPIHQAIVNEDVQMLYFLLKHKADVHQRCYGSFFCPEDQKETRTDSLEHEWVDMQPCTAYTGRMYWGEYPLSFAACTQQPDCFRLLCAFRADPNMKDTNGNTVLHMCVIHDLQNMFQVAHQLGGKLHIQNNQKLTPLALAAKLAKKDMFDLIINTEKSVIWTCRDSVCEAYPLRGIDTIDEITGHVNPTSVLSLVVYGEDRRHLDFMDHLLDELLLNKWRAFGMQKLVKSLIGYNIYLISFFFAFLFRYPSIYNGYMDPDDYIHSDEVVSILMGNQSYYSNVTNKCDGFFCNFKDINKHLIANPRCFLWSYTDAPGEFKQLIRLICECITFVSATIQFYNEIREICHSGRRRWWKATKTFPGKLVHKMSFMFIIFMCPIRLMCSWTDYALVLENGLAIAAALTTSLHCFFFFRAIKFIGPFILMVYKILMDDVSRFLMIYSIFIIAFSQAFFLVFKSCERDADPDYENVFTSPGEALLRMFIMSVGEFGAVYKNLHSCHSITGLQGKLLFLFYELLVTVMLLNLLIAMMTRTYERIAETHKEWRRQWAQVILMLEQSISPHERLKIMIEYSRPLKADKSQRALVVKQKKDATQKNSLKKNQRKVKVLQNLMNMNNVGNNYVRRPSALSSSDISIGVD